MHRPSASAAFHGPRTHPRASDPREPRRTPGALPPEGSGEWEPEEQPRTIRKPVPRRPRHLSSLPAAATGSGSVPRCAPGSQGPPQPTPPRKGVDPRRPGAFPWRPPGRRTLVLMARARPRGGPWSVPSVAPISLPRGVRLDGRVTSGGLASGWGDLGTDPEPAPTAAPRQLLRFSKPADSRTVTAHALQSP